VSVGIGNHESRLADLDGDGDLDILSKPYTRQAPGIDVLLGRRSKLDRWQRHVVDPGRPWRSVFIDAADIDGDTRKDIISGGWWYRNPGNVGRPWQRHTIGEPLHNMAAVHDFDGDGDADILGTRAPIPMPNSSGRRTRGAVRSGFRGASPKATATSSKVSRSVASRTTGWKSRCPGTPKAKVFRCWACRARRRADRGRCA
jgi:hypothetical protein